MNGPLILASQSASRRAMLEAAGVPFEARSPNVDEEAFKAQFRADGHDARHLADALAELKARRLSDRLPGALVLGCDQTLEIEGTGGERGAMIDKAEDREQAADILRQLSGRTHFLHSAAVLCEGGAPVWRQIETARMTVRPLSDAFIDAYLDREWKECRWCVGCYRIEGPGVQLFSAVRGTQFAIQGLPLIGLLDFLRVRGVLER